MASIRWIQSNDDDVYFVPDQHSYRL